MKTDPTFLIQTDTLLLRPIVATDNKHIFEYRSDAQTNRYQNFIPKTLEEVDQFIARTARTFDQPDSWFQFLILEKATGKVLGDVGVHFIGEDGFQCEIGCTISREHQSRGWATAAMKALIDYLFHHCGKHRIFASVDPHNLPSIRLLQRLHFRKEAHMKESLYQNGVWVDDVIYALLNKEWVQKS